VLDSTAKWHYMHGPFRVNYSLQKLCLLFFAQKLPPV